MKTEAALTYLNDLLHHKESVTSAILNENFKSEVGLKEERAPNEPPSEDVSDEADETSSEIGFLSDDEELDSYLRTEDQVKIVKPLLEQRLKEHEESNAAKKRPTYGKFKRKT